jgi:heat shock protein HtpX
VLKRIGLLIATNLAILFVVNVIVMVLERAGVFGQGELLRAYGPLMVFAVVAGFGGSFVSLLISKWVAKMSTGAKVIDSPRNATEAWLFETVRSQAARAGIATPEIAIYDAPEMNAFATGPSRNNALVAVSTGLLHGMDKREVEAVVGHEISHVANGDMVTLTLIQGVLNTFVIFLSRVIGGIIDSALRGKDDRGRGGGMAYFAIVMVAQMVLGLLASLIVAWFSRQREYRADRGGATLTAPGDMISALRRLGAAHEESSLPKSMAAFGITGGGLMGLFRSHPPIEDRIRALKQPNG